MSVNELYRALYEIVGEGNILENEPLSKHTTFRIGGPARYFLTPDREEALKEVILMCKDNNIDYCLTGGSTLGAYLYKGFIPWDDDLDIAMMRKDYKKFIKALEKDLDKEKYTFHCFEKNRKYEPDYNKTAKQFLKEYEKCNKEKDYIKKVIPMTLEGCVVRISDVIAYIGRDIEDAIRLGILEIDSIPEDISNVLGKTNREIVNTITLDIINNSINKPYIPIYLVTFFCLCSNSTPHRIHNRTLFFTPLHKGCITKDL